MNKDLEILKQVVFQGGPKNPYEQGKAIQALENVSALVAELQTDILSNPTIDQSQLDELQTLNTELQELVVSLKAQIDEKTKENRTLKATVTRYKKKIKNETQD